MIRRLSRAVLAAAGLASVAASGAAAHHGFGRFDMNGAIELEGVLTGVDFVNPHSWLYFDAEGPDGAVTPMRCEMRAATVLRRSGWSAEMFTPGLHVAISGRPHLDDPSSCYVETITLGDSPTLERYEQLSGDGLVSAEGRPLRLASGELNISGDWAQEQYLLASPPGGGPGRLAPKSMVAGVESGEIAVEDVPDPGWGGRPVSYTRAGQEARDALLAVPPEDSPNMRCEFTSILHDWVFDGPVNRITQHGDTITLEYGRHGVVRTVHMDMTEHPAGLAPSRTGHSIGRWEWDILVVDTAAFAPGQLARGVPHSDQLRVTELFILDQDTGALTREYVAEDPLFFADQYVGADTVRLADAPFAVDPCEDLTLIDYSAQAGGGE